MPAILKVTKIRHDRNTEMLSRGRCLDTFLVIVEKRGLVLRSL